MLIRLFKCWVGVAAGDTHKYRYIWLFHHANEETVAVQNKFTKKQEAYNSYSEQQAPSNSPPLDR